MEDTETLLRGYFPHSSVYDRRRVRRHQPGAVFCRGNGPKTLKDTYGKDIVFWGGGVDTQQVLPFGRPEEVRRQVLERLEIFSKDGGYVFNTIHNIQANTPIENIAAMIEAVKEFNGDR